MSVMRWASTNYGIAIGIIMVDSTFPRPPGDVGNATTFKYPVVYRAVKGVVPPVELVSSGDLTYLPQVIDAAQALQSEGVRAIVGGCGFLAIFQEELVKAVQVPVFTSTLILVPVIHRTLKRDQKVGILTANAEWLTEKHFEAVGWSRDLIPVAISGVGITGMDGLSPNDPTVQEGIVQVARQLTTDHPEVGAIMLECTNLPPYAKAIQDAVKIPIFDIVTMTNMVFDMVVRRKFDGFI